MTLPAAVSASRNEVRTVAPRLIALRPSVMSGAKVVKQVFEEVKA